MESLPVSIFSEREQELLNELTGICNANHIEIKINILPIGNFKNQTVSLDVEHDECGNFVGCGLFDGNVVYYYSDVLLLRHIDFSTIHVIAHNGVSDFDCLRHWSIPITEASLYWDTELLSHIRDSSRKGYGLKKLAEADLGIIYPSYDDICGKRSAKERRTLDKWPIEIVSRYNALDCYVTYKLYEQQKKQTSETGQHYFRRLERPIARILSDMSNRGVRVDLHYLKGLKETLECQKAPIEEAIKNELGEINLNSPKQLLEALHAKKIYPELKGKPSTDKRALANCQDIFVVRQLLKYSELETLLSAFVYPYLERGTSIVHPFFNSCGTRTGRLSCSNPNLQQIPRKTTNGNLVRRMFIPREGMGMGKADYGQIDLRAMAELSQDETMCTLFKSGESIHNFTQRRMELGGVIGEGTEYDKAKVFNLSVGYRATAYSVQRQLGDTLEEAQKEIDKWWALFPGIRRWQEKLIYDSKRSGFCTTLLGLRIRVDGLDSPISWKREAAERQLINNVCQGSAAELIKLAMIQIYKRLNEFSPLFGLLIQVHDDLVFESPDIEKDSSLITECMETAYKLSVPLVVDCKIGRNWGEMK